MAINGIEYKSPENKRWAEVGVERTLQAILLRLEKIELDLQRVTEAVRKLGGAV